VAKRKNSPDGVNKSALVREVLQKDPKTPTKEVVGALGQRGVEVSPKLVYLIKSKLRHKRRRAQRARAVEASRDAGLADPVELVREVRRLAERAGGLKRLQALVDLLAE